MIAVRFRPLRGLAVPGVAIVVLCGAMFLGGPLRPAAALDELRPSGAPERPVLSGVTSADGAAAKAVTRIREGDKLTDVVGTFKLTGDRLTFYTADGTRALNGLENLNLERITKMVGDSPDLLEWRVSGIVTEYRGANFLLVTQAVVKNKPARQTTPTPTP